MRLRRVVPSRIVNPLIKATKAGLGLNINQLESHFLAGGNVDRVVNALIAAQRANIPLIFERAAAIDLAGRDVLQAVQMSVNPRVIETPIVAAVAKDGIEVKVKGARNGSCEYRSSRRRCRRRNDHRSCRRRYCHDGGFG